MKGPGSKKAPGMRSAKAMPLELTSTAALPTKNPAFPLVPCPQITHPYLKGPEAYSVLPQLWAEGGRGFLSVSSVSAMRSSSQSSSYAFSWGLERRLAQVLIRKKLRKAGLGPAHWNPRENSFNLRPRPYAWVLAGKASVFHRQHLWYRGSEYGLLIQVACV